MKITNRIFKTAMLSTISVASLGFGTVAYAQNEAPQAEEATEDEDVIIVTATKREQTLQEIPISVSVTSGETIERAQVRDLVDRLMGRNPEHRFTFIQENAARIEEEAIDA